MKCPNKHSERRGLNLVMQYSTVDKICIASMPLPVFPENAIHSRLDNFQNS